MTEKTMGAIPVSALERLEQSAVKLSPTFCAYCGKPLKIIGTERFCNNVQCFNRFQNV